MKPVFIHISKNAGTSIVNSAADNIVVAGHRPAASWVASHGRESPLFAVIRNPYDRVFSEYRFRRRRYEAGERNTHLSILGHSFEDWALATYRDGVFRTRSFFDQTDFEYNRQNMVDDTLIWFVSQCRWLYDEAGQNLAEDLLRYESLESDWSRFTKKHGFACALQHLNASLGNPDLRDRYSKQTRELIYDYYREDFDAFGYPY